MKKKPRAKTKARSKAKAAALPGPELGVSTLMYKKSAARFGKLLETDPQASLEQRYRWIAKNYPNIVADFGYVPMILDHGLAVVAVPEDGVIYTIGLQYRLGHPELLIKSSKLGDADYVTELKGTLNELASCIADGDRVADGTVVTIRDRKRKFHALQDDQFEKFPCGIFARFEDIFADRFHSRGGTLPILWTDET